MFSGRVHLLPLLWCLSVCVTIFTPYIIAVSLDHVHPFLPTISLTAAFEPEGSIFGFLMTIAAFLGLLTIICRYLQFHGVLKDFEQNSSQKVQRYNKIALPFGVLCVLGVVLVANFRIPLDYEASLVECQSYLRVVMI